jgi:hypothetical protein
LDGELGTGSEVLVTLSEGQHMIRLEAADSDDNTAAVSVNILVGRRVHLPIILRNG